MSDTEYISKDAFVTQQRKQYCENCERRKGTKNGKRIFVYEIGEAPCRACDIGDMIDAVWDFTAADVVPNITHCKDCKYFFSELGGDYGSCTRIQGGDVVKDTDYCSRAKERKL